MWPMVRHLQAERASGHRVSLFETGYLGSSGQLIHTFCNMDPGVSIRKVILHIDGERPAFYDRPKRCQWPLIVPLGGGDLLPRSGPTMGQ